jgi:hypothetical protein
MSESGRGVVVTNRDLLERMISSQERAVRYYIFFAVLLLLLGLGLVSVALLSLGTLESVQRTLLSIGGTFVSSLSAFPLKEILSRKEKVQMFESLIDRLPELAKAANADDNATRQRIDELLWRVIEKTVTE